MRKHTRIGVVTGALLLGLVAPGVTHGIDDLVKGAIRAAIRFFGGTKVDEAAVKAATRQLEQTVPVIVRTPWGTVVEPNQRQRWQLIHVACRAKDVWELQREDEVDKQLLQLGTELPGAIGFGWAVYNLANELDDARTFGDKTRKAAAAALCTAAEGALKQPR